MQFVCQHRRTDGMWKVPTLLPFPQLRGYHQADQLSRDFFCFVSVIHGFVFWYFNSEPSVGYGVQGGKGLPVLCKLGCRSPAEA